MQHIYTLLFILCASGLAVAQAPTTAPPTPTVEAERVISLYSDAYTDVTLDTWLTEWSAATQAEVTIADNQVLKYDVLSFAGIEMTGANALDLAAAEITHLHFDFWSPNSTAFRVKLVDFGGDGFEPQGNNTEAEVGRSLAQGEWVSVDLSIGLFSGMNLSDISQFIISSDPAATSTVYLDNIYFYSGGETGGSTPLDLPVTFEDADVTYGLVDFGGTASQVVTDPTDAENRVAETTKGAGAETWAGTTLTLDQGGTPNDPGFASPLPFTATETTVSVRVWSPAAGTPIRLKVEASNDPTVSVETETNTTVAMEWETLVFDFANEATGTAALNLASRYNKMSIFFNFGTQPTEAATYYWDDVTFGGESTGGGSGGGSDDEPQVAAPAPDRDAENVISLFSDVYTDVTVDTWRTEWSSADYSEISIDGDAVKKYANLDFAGIETTGANALDLMAAGMTHLHVDFWSANSTTFRVKMVDFGGDGFDNGTDTEGEIVRTPENGEWVSLDYELSAFAGMNLSDISQIIISSLPAGGSTVYLDNIYFYKGETGGGGDNQPQVGAPAPVHEGDDIISLFSEAYTDVTVDTWRTEWSSAGYAEVEIDGNPTKLYSNLDFAGIETTGDNALDLTGMTHLHLDYWSADLDTFRVKLVDFGMDGFDNGTDTEFEIAFKVTKGEWVRLDIALADFEGMNQSDINQFILSALPTGSGSLYLDNIYFYNDATVGTPRPEAGILSAYPNPATDRILITAPVRMESLLLFDAAGRLVSEHQPAAEQYALPLADLRPGLYVALVTTQRGQFTVKLRKQ